MKRRGRGKSAKQVGVFRESDKGGIPDWDKKRAAFETMFDAFGDKEFVATIIGDHPTLGDNYKRSVVGSLKSWYTHKPQGHKQFFICLAEALKVWLRQMNVESTINGRTIIDCAYDELYHLIPKHARVGLPAPQHDQSTHGEVELDAIEHPVWVSRTYSIETTRDGLKSGRLDQRLYYLNPDSAEYWKELIDSEQYNQYGECKEALEVLVTRPAWKEFFKEPQGDGVIMLGGGSPTKDLVLIRSLLSLKPDKEQVHYAMIDISQYMLLSAFRLVDSTLRRMKVLSRVQLCTLCWDFMDLVGARKRLRRENRNVAWVLPGGTIGNLDELRFFKSLAAKSILGDLLIVGAEIKGTHTVEEQQKLLTSKYDQEAFRNFITGPLRSVWHNLDDARSFQGALDHLKIAVVDGMENEHSRIPGSVSVEVSIEVANRKIVLLTSTRYDERLFVDFARKRSFELVDTVASNRNPDFKCFVFKRTMLANE